MDKHSKSPYVIRFNTFQRSSMTTGWRKKHLGPPPARVRPGAFKRGAQMKNDARALAMENKDGIHIYIYNLVGGMPTPLKNMSSSVGMMTFPIYGTS